MAKISDTTNTSALTLIFIGVRELYVIVRQRESERERERERGTEKDSYPGAPAFFIYCSMLSAALASLLT